MFKGRKECKPIAEVEGMIGEMDEYFNVEIGLCRTAMRFYGIWPKERNFAVYIRFVILLTVVMGFCNIPQTVKLFKVKNDFDELLEIITNCNLAVMMSVLKTVSFWRNYKALGWLADAMAKDWTTAMTEMERKITRKTAKLSRSITIIMLWSVESAVFSFLIVNSYYRWKESQLFEQGKINASERVRPLYMKAEFPYDIQRTPYYEITWILQFLSTLFSSSTFSLIDGFFSTLVLHLCAQLRNLRGQLKRRLAEAARSKDNPDSALNLSAVVERHEFLMRFAQTIEDIFNLPFLVQLLSSILIFCLCSYQIVKVITSDVVFLLDLVFAVYYYISVAASLFVYCLIATLLSTESTKMRETAYNSEWYELSPADARPLILIMIRTQQPLEFTAGKFVAFSLELYCSVLKTSVGYLSVLLAMKDTLQADS
ncbi:odorant receptor 82a-like [Phymastichus coffea]|uniref:odorant receptor 82a-like n=1 Tax=Phymastichus coffea TaxID=108790 RepID=UPI00273AC8A8|nr:odorant receptor 82a-like [Phymastichus coffea]